MKTAFEISDTFKATPEEVYAAWLDSEKHAAMTGGGAECSTEVGGTFSAWDGYITGQNKALIPNQEIVQSWRTVEFAEADEDSALIIKLAPAAVGSCALTLIHTNIPEGQPDYNQGWKDNYFSPMHQYFGQ